METLRTKKIPEQLPEFGGMPDDELLEATKSAVNKKLLQVRHSAVKNILLHETINSDTIDSVSTIIEVEARSCKKFQDLHAPGPNH